MADDTQKPDNNEHIPPFANTPMSGNENRSFEDTPSGIDNDVPAVAESAKKSVTVVAIVVVVILFLTYNLFIKEDEKEVEASKPKPLTAPTTEAKVPEPVVTPTVQNAAPTMISPEIEIAAAPPPPPPPPPPVPEITQPAPTIPSSAQSNYRPMQQPQILPSRGGKNAAPNDIEQKRQQRIQAQMLIGAKGGDKIGPSRTELEDGDFEPTDTTFQNVKVTKVGNPFTTVLQGKIVDAVLETAINSDLPGVLRAIMSRDVYAEKGNTILIPKGSRLIGTYESDVKRGQARIYIIWNRVIRPDGIDVALESPATDVLGRSGVAGAVDNKYLEIFSNSMLLSTITIGFAAATEALGLASDGVEQGETGSGSATTSGSVTDIATLQAVEDFSSTAQDVVGELLNIKPTVTIDQGTKIKVFVNRDIRFPNDLTTGLNVLQ